MVWGKDQSVLTICNVITGWYDTIEIRYPTEQLEINE